MHAMKCWYPLWGICLHLSCSFGRNHTDILCNIKSESPLNTHRDQPVTKSCPFVCPYMHLITSNNVKFNGIAIMTD